MSELPTEHCFDYVAENITSDELYEWFITDFRKKPFRVQGVIIRELTEIKMGIK